jgi:hypothetical protein
MNTKEITIYNAEGRILYNMIASASTYDFFISNNTSMIPGMYNSTEYYIVDKIATPLLVNPTILTDNTLTEVPVGSTVTVNDKVYIASESIVELSFTQPGTYSIVVSLFPYLDAQFKVTV